MKLFILVRATIPWKELTYKTYQTKSGYFAGRWMYRVNISLKAWQSSFKMSFFEYRDRIYQVAKRNWEKVEKVEDILISDGSHKSILKIVNKLQGEKDSLIIPIDDDDWLDPNSSYALEKYSHRPIIHWRQGSYDPYIHKDNIFEIRKGKPYHFFTNNYAYTPFVYSFVDDFDKAEMTLMHLHFNDMVKEDRFSEMRCNWISIPRCLGVTNKTLASLSKLNKKNTIAHFKAHMARHRTTKQDQDGLRETLQHAPWALEPIRETEILHKELEDSICKRFTLDMIAENQ